MTYMINIKKMIFRKILDYVKEIILRTILQNR